MAASGLFLPIATGHFGSTAALDRGLKCVRKGISLGRRGDRDLPSGLTFFVWKTLISGATKTGMCTRHGEAH
jgi:hypothetical protein